MEELDWQIIGRDAKHPYRPNTWRAEFGAGYLVVHASPTGTESMVYVPHAVSGLGEPPVRTYPRGKPTPMPAMDDEASS